MHPDFVVLNGIAAAVLLVWWLLHRRKPVAKRAGPAITLTYELGGPTFTFHAEQLHTLGTMCYQYEAKVNISYFTKHPHGPGLYAWAADDLSTSVKL